MNLRANENALSKYKDFDIAVTVKEKKDSFFYSNDFISLNNIVISRTKDKLQINSMKDLEAKNIIAFQGAVKYLNISLNKLKIKTYKEEKDQEKQVRDFLAKKSDLIILDINIFKWYLQKLSKQDLSNFIFHDIFPNKNTFKVAFRNKNLRNIFNKNLKKIIDSGKYKEISDEYLVNNIEKKVEIASLLSSILSKYILEENISEIKKITKVFDSLSYINKIEVFTNNKNIYSSNDKIFTSNIIQDSFFNFSNTPRKVGYIKVYFNNKHLKEAINANTLVPTIKEFINLSSYLYIKNIYTNNLSQNNINRFTKKEKKFIKNHKIIKYSTLNWEPISILKKGEISGIMHDYINIIEEETGLSFVYEKSKSWTSIKEKFETFKIDLFSKTKYFKDTNKNNLDSKEISHFHFAIVTREDGSFADEIDDISDKVLALPKNYPSYDFIQKNYPKIRIIETNTIKEALALVSQKKAYAFISYTEVAIYNIKKYFPNLKIVGITENKFIHNFSIQEKYPELKSIINKVLSSISHKQKQDIRDKYIQNKINTAVNYKIIYQLLFIFVLILLIILYFLKKLSKAKKYIEKKSFQMQEQKDLFEALFNGSSDGLTIIENNKLIDCNIALLKMYKIKNKTTLKEGKLGELSPQYQENNILSSKVFEKRKKECLKNGISSYEWLAKKTTGEIFWANMILVNIKTNNKNLIYSISRDISKSKFLEEEIKNRAKDLTLSNKDLENSNKELQTSIQNLEEAQNKLIESEKMASLGGLVAGVAHEINTPVGIGLTGITHFEELTSEILKKYKNEEMSQEEFEEYLYTSKDLGILIHKNLEKAASLVRSFKQVAVDQSSEEKRIFNINRYLYEILESIHSVTKKTDIKIDFSCDENLSINSYPGAFSQVITNLIMNSLIHAFDKKEKGNISISINHDNDKIKITYKDNGRGIKEENLSKIFDPFFTTNRENGGSGLGLNIIYTIINSKLNGSISCKSAKNEGVEFIIIFRTEIV